MATAMIEIEPFIARALLAGIGVAATAGALGCFIVWRRMAYFGDSVAHGALLGAALGLLAGVHVNIGIAAVCVAFAALLAWMRHRRFAATDTLLGIFAHTPRSPSECWPRTPPDAVWICTPICWAIFCLSTTPICCG